MASTGATPLPNNLQKGEYVSSNDCIRRILFFNFGNTENRISGAVADALEKAAKKGQPADALINVEISTSYTNLFIYASDCIEAKGQAVGLQVIHITHFSRATQIAEPFIIQQELFLTALHSPFI